MKETQIINFCINLDRRPDRWEKMQKRFADQDLKVHRWSAIDAKEYGFSGPAGVMHSHINLLYYCKNLQCEYVMIFEDDVVFCHNFKLVLQNMVNELPSDWEALSLHCYKAETIEINKYICKLLSFTYGSHGILFNKKGINKILNGDYINKVCLEELYFKSLNNFYAVNLDYTMAFQTGEDSDVPETCIVDEYRHLYEKYKHLHS